MSDFQTPSSNDDAQIRRIIDQLASNEEFAAFNQRLQADASLRARYVYQIDLEATLRDEFSEISQRTTPVAPVAGPQRIDGSGRLRTSATWMLGVAVLAIGALLVRERALDQSKKPIAASNPLDSQNNFVAFAADTNSRTADAAVVVRVNGATGPDLFVGKRLKPGVLKLTTGQVQLEFVSGAIVAVEGPAELRIESKDVVQMMSGIASTRVPPRARGFVFNAPDAAVVDLGTEFGVKIDDSGTSEVEVTSGEVQLSLLGDDGNTLLSQLVTEMKRIRVDSPGQQLIAVEHNSIDLPQITEADESGLGVASSYVDAVLSESPALYWRFESTVDGMVPNEVADQWGGKIHMADSDPDSIRIENGHAHFAVAETPRYLFTEERLVGLNEGPYSIEFWMKPDTMNRATCVGLYPDENAVVHLNVVEIATETELVHDPGAIRFLHRNPPARSLELGTNAYTNGVCIPGQWQHIVAVKHDHALELYFNGQIARRVATTDSNSKDEFRVAVGQLHLFDTVRQFVGLIDEFAIYRQALSASTINNHYQLIVSEPTH